MTINSEADVQGLFAAGRAVRAAFERMRGMAQPGVTTAELDGIGHLEDGVHHTEASVARVVHDGLVADPEGVGGGARRRRFEVVPTDASVDQHADLFRRDPGHRERFASRPGGAVGHALTGIPEAALAHTGQCLNLARR